MNGMVIDIKQGLRGLVRRPSFSTVVVLTLAVGIGANTAIFQVAREVLLKPYPYPDPERVVVLAGFSEREQSISRNVSYPNAFDVGAGASVLSGVAAIRWWEPALAQADGASVLRGGTVTANFFEVLRVVPGLGRFFLPEEEGVGRRSVVVLSYPLWQGRFGGDPGIVGRTLDLNGIGYEVIGVTSADFEHPGLLGSPGGEPLLWRTVDSPPSEWPRSGRSWKAIGRIEDGVELTTAQAQVSALMASLAETFPEHNANRGMRLIPVREAVVGSSRLAIVTLAGSVALLLIVACANLTSLFLSRALDQRREASIERAMGATRWRLVRKSLVETALFAFLGGGLGILLAVALGGLFKTFGTLVLPRPVDLKLDGTIVAVAAALSLSVALFFGLVPAVQAARVETVAPDGSASRSHTMGRRTKGVQRGLVVAEVALTSVLVVGAGLLLRTFDRLGKVELGLVTDGVITMELHGSAWWDLEQEAAAAQWTSVLEAVRGVPGVAQAGALDYVPLGGSYSCDGVYRADRPEPGPGEGSCAETRSTLPGALEALGVGLVAGRRITAVDSRSGALAAVVDQSMADTYWPGEDPIGKPLYVHTRIHEVVGVVNDIGHFGPGREERPTVYIPTPQEGWSGAARGLALVIRTDGEPGAVVPSIRRAVWGVNPAIAFGEVNTLDQLLRENLAGPRFRSLLLAAFGLTGLLLATLGVGGVLTHSVSRRIREMGIRMAVGASPRRVRRMVVREGLLLTGIGLVLGLLGAAGLSRFVGALLYGVGGTDPLVFGVAPIILGLTGVGASMLPAIRASRVRIADSLTSE
jgi:predicted permease